MGQLYIDWDGRELCSQCRGPLPAKPIVRPFMPGGPGPFCSDDCTEISYRVAEANRLWPADDFDETMRWR